MYFYLLALLVVLVDQILKYLIHSLMQLGQSIPFLGFIKLTYVRNTGAAFSLFSGFSTYLMMIGFIVALIVIYYHYKISQRSYLLQTGLSFILGGSLGNLVDRLVRSYVIDYIDITVWPVFNFADMMINLGVVLVVIKVLTWSKQDAADSL